MQISHPDVIRCYDEVDATLMTGAYNADDVSLKIAEKIADDD